MIFLMIQMLYQEMNNRIYCSYEAIRISAAPTIERPSGIYWDSTDAKKLFGARPDDENVLTTLEQKIDILKASNQTAEGYRCVIFGRDPRNICI